MSAVVTPLPHASLCPVRRVSAMPTHDAALPKPAAALSAAQMVEGQPDTRPTPSQETSPQHAR